MSRKLFSAGTFLLLFAWIACGISFFSPWWLQNAPKYLHDKNIYIARYNKDFMKVSYLKNISSNATALNLTNGSMNIETIDLGLWALYDSNGCQWFWEDSSTLQINLFTETQWYLACQVLYIIACFLLVFTEIYSKVQLCFKERKVHYRVMWICLLLSAILQLCTLAIYGDGSQRTFNALSVTVDEAVDRRPYLGWSYWMSIPGIILTTSSCLVLIVADIWTFRDKL